MAESSPKVSDGAEAQDPATEPVAAEKKAEPGFAPEVFGKYYLVDKIAVGGMAEIFKAKTFGAGGFEAVSVIKRILKHLSDNEQFVRMFMDEAKVSALLHHNNVVRIFDFGKQRDNYFIAMEYVEGKDVKQILRKLAERRKLLPQEFAVYIAMEAAKGLDYAHKRTTLQGAPLNIVHRDVSPSNLLLSYNGEVKVADFGIVKAANVAEDTDHGTLKGKFEYMSPEQAQGLELDRRSDLFSLGIILHEMLTGRRAFKSENEIRTLERIKNVEIEKPSFFNPRVPPRLDEIVMKALSKNPDDRYQDGRSMQVDLLEFLYPASPDLTQQTLSHFMRELFAEDMEGERRRLEEGTRLALELHESSQMELEEGWEEGPSKGHTSNTPSQQTVANQALAPAPTPPPPAPSRLPILIAVAAVMLLVGAVSVFVAAPLLFPKEAPPVAPTTAALELRIAPVSGKVTVDGAPAGEGTTVTVPGLTADVPHAVRVEAEGYQPFEETDTLGAGEKLRIQVTLAPVGAAETSTSAKVEAPPVEPKPPERPDPPRDRDPKPDKTPAATTTTSTTPAPASPPTVRFSSSPAGAEVFVDGRLVGKTPVTWKDGSPGDKASVEYRLGGYESTKFSVSVPGAGDSTSADRTLKEQAKGEGKLNVNVMGGSWGDIYVDGKLVGRTPKFGIALAAGTYKVNVKNAETGLDKSQTVTVVAGETKTATFSAD